ISLIDLSSPTEDLTQIVRSRKGPEVAFAQYPFANGKHVPRERLRIRQAVLHLHQDPGEIIHYHERLQVLITQTISHDGEQPFVSDACVVNSPQPGPRLRKVEREPSDMRITFSKMLSGNLMRMTAKVFCEQVLTTAI